MINTLRLLLILIVNGVTIYGVFRLHWGIGTAIAIYWCENVIGIVLISLLFVLHRGMTHKRGHTKRVLAGFLAKAIPFTLAHGLFVWVMVGPVLSDYAATHRGVNEQFNLATFKTGMMYVGGSMLLRFLVETVRLKKMPFLQLRIQADSFLTRVIVVHMTIILGLFALVAVGHPRGLFIVFAALKLMADLMAGKASEELPDKPAGFGLWISRKIGVEQMLIDRWNRDRDAIRERIADDELVQA
jgi:uncharacterized protein DUF6498